MTRCHLALVSWLCIAAPVAAQTDRAEAVARSTVQGEAVVTGTSRSGRSGLTYVYIRPAVGGIEVADDPALVVVDDNGIIVYRHGTLEAGAVESDAERLAPAEAAQRAAGALGLAGITAVAGRAPGSARPGETQLIGPGLGAASSARRVFVRTDAGVLRLAYEVALYPADPAAWAVSHIDAATGEVLSLRRLAVAESGAMPVARPEVPVELPVQPAAVLAGSAAGGASDGASYLAFPGRSPLDGDRVLLRSPALVAASPYGWHDTDGLPGAEFTTTRGNNVHAFPDRDSDGLPDAAGTPDGGASLVFAPPLDLGGEPSSYTEAAVTNAFVWANHAHDVLYGYGFDEAGGNFQANGYGRGGDPRPDPVTIFVQNGSSTDNAYMAVPPDGGSPSLLLLESTRTAPRRDFAFDTEVVLHEYAHGVTTRLTAGGGPSTSQCIGIGIEDQGLSEGWSDWYAMMLTMRPGDTRTTPRTYGTYTAGVPGGARSVPYTTAFAANNLTYGRTNTATGRHSTGTVWATILWEVTWDLIDAYGFDPDLANAEGGAGNQIALSLVTEALRLQPCRPGFVSARNAILYADLLLYNSAHIPLLQTAFARRGLGQGARQGSSSVNADNIESFVVDTGLGDVIPPGPIANLTASVASSPSAVRQFIAPGDDGAFGTVSTYEVRVSSTRFTSVADVERAPQVQRTGQPVPGGQDQTLTVLGVPLGVQVYLAVRALDEAGNISPYATVGLRLPGSSFPTPPSPTPTPPPPPPRVVQATTEDVHVSGDAGATAVGHLRLRNGGAREQQIRVEAAGTAELGRLMTFITRQTLAHTVDEPYATLGAAGVPVLAWTPLEPGTRSPEDAGFADVALPFPFPLGGDVFTSIRIYTDGFVSFVPGNLPTGGVAQIYLPNPALPNGIVAPFMADLAPASGGQVLTGTLPDGRFVVEYRQMQVVTEPDSAPVGFVVTFAQSGEIRLAYDRITPSAARLVGVESADGQGAFITRREVSNTTLILVNPTGVLSVTPAQFSLVSGGQLDLTVEVRTAGLPPGRYAAEVSVISTEPVESVTERLVLPLRINVEARGSAPPPAEPPAEPPTEPSAGPAELTLQRVQPNPARSTTTMTYGTPEAVPVRLAVYDSRGREVAVLAEGAAEAGWHDAEWRVQGAAAGLYVVRLVAGSEVRTTTVVVVR